jgi:hypothetical protein
MIKLRSHELLRISGKNSSCKAYLLHPYKGETVRE